LRLRSLAELTTLFEGATTKRDRSQDESLPLEERLKRHIIDGERIGLESQLELAQQPSAYHQYFTLA